MPSFDQVTGFLLHRIFLKKFSNRKLENDSFNNIQDQSSIVHFDEDSAAFKIFNPGNQPKFSINKFWNRSAS